MHVIVAQCDRAAQAMAGCDGGGEGLGDARGHCRVVLLPLSERAIGAGRVIAVRLGDGVAEQEDEVGRGLPSRRRREHVLKQAIRSSTLGLTKRPDRMARPKQAGVGAAAGREDASLHLEEKKQQGTQPQRVEPSSEAAKRLKSIESMYNGGTPARPFGESHFFAVERVAPRT